MGACRSKHLNVWPYMTSKSGMMMRGNVGIHGLKGFNGRPIVTCDNAIVTAKRCGSKGFDVWPIVTCDNGIITAWVCRLRGFDMLVFALLSKIDSKQGTNVEQ